MTKPANRIRVIGGKWRGSRISVADLPGLRPTGDRVRETLFNWLMADIAGARCLDAFSGSGVLGFEALSRGAREILAFESAATAANAIRDTISRLGADDFHLQQQSFFVEHGYAGEPFDIVFIDPPFAQDLHTMALDYLIQHKLLAERALVYLEMPAEQAAQSLSEHWHIKKSKTAGAVWFALLQYIPSASEQGNL